MRAVSRSTVNLVPYRLERGRQERWGELTGATKRRVRTLSAWAVMVVACGLREGNAQSPTQSLDQVTFVAFDLETTGLLPSRDAVVEMAAVRFRDAKVLEARSWLVHPQRPIPAEATRVHGITDDMVSDRPTFREVFGEFRTFCGGAILLAHHARFDVEFLAEECRRAGLPPLTNAVVDTLRLSRALFPELSSHAVEALVRTFGLREGAYHRALADAFYLQALFACPDFVARLPRTVGDLLALAEVRSAARIATPATGPTETP